MEVKYFPCLHNTQDTRPAPVLVCVFGMGCRWVVLTPPCHWRASFDHLTCHSTKRGKDPALLQITVYHWFQWGLNCRYWRRIWQSLLLFRLGWCGTIGASFVVQMTYTSAGFHSVKKAWRSSWISTDSNQNSWIVGILKCLQWRLRSSLENTFKKFLVVEFPLPRSLLSNCWCQ